MHPRRCTLLSLSPTPECLHEAFERRSMLHSCAGPACQRSKKRAPWQPGVLHPGHRYPCAFCGYSSARYPSFLVRIISKLLLLFFVPLSCPCHFCFLSPSIHSMPQNSLFVFSTHYVPRLYYTILLCCAATLKTLRTVVFTKRPCNSLFFHWREWSFCRPCILFSTSWA